MVIAATPSVQWVDSAGNVSVQTLPWRLPTVGRIPPAISTLSTELVDQLRGAAIEVVHEVTGRRFELRRRVLRVIRPGARDDVVRFDLGLVDPLFTPRNVIAVRVDGVPTFDWVQAEEFLYPIPGTRLEALLAGAGPYTTTRLEIEVDEGEPVEALVLQAAAYLFAEFVKLAVGDECDLPANATSVSRDGVSVQLSTDFTESVPILGIVKRLAGTRQSWRMIDPVKFPVVIPVSSTTTPNAAARNLIAVAGDTETYEFGFVRLADGAPVPEDISGRTYAALVRTTPTGSGSPAATFLCEIIDGPGGILLLTLDNSVTSGLTPGAAYWWDLQETVDGEPTTLFAGSRLIVRPSVTG